MTLIIIKKKTFTEGWRSFVGLERFRVTSDQPGSLGAALHYGIETGRLHPLH